jgi:threonine/homoserine/homoserine lactone efflux protein
MKPVIKLGRFALGITRSDAMPTAESYAAFLVAVISMQLVPGPETTLIISRGIGQGRTIALCTVLGTTLAAGAVQLPILALGIASVIHSAPWAFDLVRWGGATYLIWLGAGLLFRRVAAQRVANGPVTAPSPLSAMRDGLVANLTNANSLVFMLAFLPQFVDPSRGSATAQLLLLGATQKVTGFLVLSATALASGTMGEWLARKRGFLVWQERFAGTVMIVLGLRLFIIGSSASR